MDRKAVSPVIAIVLLLMMTVAAAGAAYFWLTSIQSRMQKSAGGRIEAITKSVSTRVIAQATICKAPAEDDLVGYWKFDQGEGKTAEDSAGDNEGDIKDASWVKYGERYALNFDGTVDSYVDCGTDPSLNVGTGDFTVSAWVKFASTQKDDMGVIVSKKRYLDPGSPGWILYFHSNNIIKARVDNGTEQIDFSVAPTYNGKWHYLVLTYDSDATSNALKLYKDGEIWVQGGDGTTVTNINSSYPFTIAQEGRQNTGQALHTSEDETRFYDKALTGEAAKAAERVDVTVYNAGVEEVPKGTWVANLIKNGNTIESDTYNASKLDSEERITLHFYFAKMCPNQEYTIELEGTATSTTVSC